MNGPVDRTFSIVDVSGFTALTESHGDVHAADLAEHLVPASRALLSEQDVLVKSLGDAVLLASHTTEASLEFVQRLFASCAEVDRYPPASGRAASRGRPSVAGMTTSVPGEPLQHE